MLSSNVIYMCASVFLSLFKRYSTLTALLAQAKTFEVDFKFVINFPIDAGVFYFSCNASYGSCFCVPFWLPSLPCLLPGHSVSCCLLYHECACHVLYCIFLSMTQVVHIHEYIILYQQLKLKCWFFLVLLWLWLLMITCVKFWNASFWCACLGAIAFNASFCSLS